MKELEHIKSKMLGGYLGQSIQLFLKFTISKFPDVHKELILIYSSYNDVEKKIRTQQISFEQEQLIKARLTNAVIEMLEEVTSAVANESEKNQIDPTFETKNSDRNLHESNIKILFLAANPIDSSRLRIEEEVSKIEKGLERAKYRDKFTLVTKWAVQVRDIQRHLLDESPNIVHFSGHGNSKGLIFENVNSQQQLVKGKALGDLFSLFSDSVMCVVLNACYSEKQARVIAQHVDNVIGMNEAIPDEAAIAFAVAFYDALGAGKNPEFAYKLGCNSIQLYGIEGHLVPQFRRKS